MSLPVAFLRQCPGPGTAETRACAIISYGGVLLFLHPRSLQGRHRTRQPRDLLDGVPLNTPGRPGVSIVNTIRRLALRLVRLAVTATVVATLVLVLDAILLNNGHEGDG